MADGSGTRPLRCSECGHSDFFVLSKGVAYRGGTLCETYRWPEGLAEARAELAARKASEGELDESFDTSHLHDHGYFVEQQVLEEPELHSVEGPVRALCAQCLHDVTDLYLQLGREDMLPV